MVGLINFKQSIYLWRYIQEDTYAKIYSQIIFFIKSIMAFGRKVRGNYDNGSWQTHGHVKI